MKDKDPNEDEFNQDEQDNINEADDSFGLPDLDFDTLDEAGEEEEKQEETPAAEEESPAETGAEEPVAETSGEEPVAEVVAEAAEEQPPTAENTAADTAEGDSGIEAEDKGGGEEEPPQRKYVPPKPESNAPKMIAVILAVIVVSVGVWYFMFYRPQAQAAEKARLEAAAKKETAAKKLAEAKRLEAERKRAEEDANKAADEDESASATTEAGTFNTISAPTGRYYVIVESFVDSDMAADYGNKLAADGVSTTLLAPLEGKKKLHRLALGDYGSFMEAQEAANKLKAEFGETLWVLKY